MLNAEQALTDTLSLETLFAELDFYGFKEALFQFPGLIVIL